MAGGWGSGGGCGDRAGDTHGDRTPTPTPTATQTPTAAPTQPQAGPVANSGANLRAGPGTDYAVVGGVTAGQALDVVGRNQAGDWLRLADGRWIAAGLVAGVTGELAVVEEAVVAERGAPGLEVAVEATAAVAEPPSPSSAGQVVIESVFYDGLVSRVESDEYAVIANQGGAPVNLQGWRLNAGSDGQDFRFPALDLAPGEQVRVYTNEVHPETGGLSFGSGQAIWNNGGDCGYLYDAGGVEVSRYCY